MVSVKKYKKLSAYIVVFFLLFICIGCDSITQIFYPELPVETLDKICEARGGLNNPGPLYVDGYYQPTAGPMFGIDQVMTRLTNGRFQYFEMDTDWVNLDYNWAHFEISKIKGSGRYTRFYIAEHGDPNCEAYEEYYKRHMKAKRKLSLRASGLYPEYCIAAIRTDERKSQYGISLRSFQDPEMSDVTWKSTEIREFSTDKIYASFRDFTFCREGKKKNGRCLGGRENEYTCLSNWKERKRQSDSIYYETLESTPNSILKKKLTIKNVWEPVGIEIDWVEPELVEVLEGKDNIKKLLGDESLDLYDSIDAEGYAYFSSRRVPAKSDPKRWTNQKQLWAIRDVDRTLLKTDISIENPYDLKKGTFSYCCIRAIPGDGIYFIAWGGRNERYTKANNFRILKYSWDGKLGKMVAGTLPFTFNTRKQPWHYYGKLQIEKDHYSFSVLEVFSKDKNAGQWHHPSKEFRFRVPIK